MSKRIDSLLLKDILDAIDRIENYTSGMNQRIFLKDQKTIDAVTRNLEIIGEASKFISQNIQNSIDLPWKRIIGIRNIIVHEYFGVDAKIIWRIVKEQLDELEVALKKILKEIEKT